MYGISDDKRLLLRILFARLARDIPAMPAAELRGLLADADGRDLARISDEFVALTRRAFALGVEAAPEQRHTVTVYLLNRRDSRSDFEACVAKYRRTGWLSAEGSPALDRAGATRL